MFRKNKESLEDVIKSLENLINLKTLSDNDPILTIDNETYTLQDALDALQDKRPNKLKTIILDEIE